MIVMGVDPGMSLMESWHSISEDRTLRSWGVGFPAISLLLNCQALVIETPVAQGRPVHQNDMYRTCMSAGVYVGWWRCWFGGPGPVYLVPRQVLMTQLGVSGGDSELAAHLVGTRMAEGKRDVRDNLRVSTPGLTSTHLRAAFAAALFNVTHPDNQKYRMEI